jgi:hypothetical protein
VLIGLKDIIDYALPMAGYSKVLIDKIARPTNLCIAGLTATR